jgi:hypothetical protein
MEPLRAYGFESIYDQEVSISTTPDYPDGKPRYIKNIFDVQDFILFWQSDDSYDYSQCSCGYDTWNAIIVYIPTIKIWCFIRTICMCASYDSEQSHDIIVATSLRSLYLQGMVLYTRNIITRETKITPEMLEAYDVIFEEDDNTYFSYLCYDLKYLLHEYLYLSMLVAV